jgi:acyl transferase domain-containing protein/NAD(P)-dependent dehydrogenase (short-subunit alcohol dehydrogenase family)/NAD(P)H-dependent flavin oxidoreductase YrpB (nitropropane dioxygenase family)
MTRVSDRAAFAEAVADAGGLPFLALALMSGPEVRGLLEETTRRLGDRPWGVGILGFVPPEIRKDQLAVVHEVCPPVALIAGGRPSQAASLEAAGITTFLHVPSPGLLDRFLKEGARRFVFEGRECGGHVGPRSSFALWDAQVERLLAFGGVEELSILFAGGVHDAGSAAMVGALAGPLAARGAAVGVLMGTAYLFTEEAVIEGAVVRGFQDQAVACERTVLLETSPGHLTRCVDTAYVGTFEAEKQRLRGEGRSVQDAWAELEQLNLGRLRIAAKGIQREGDTLVPVDAGSQRNEGMFMIGDIATLRDEVTTIAALHEDVSAGSTELLGALSVSPDRIAPEASLDIAIVGMACMFPGASDRARYWSNTVGGTNAITEVPAARWDPDLYYDPDAFLTDAGRKTPSKWGGFLPDVPFDALAYGIPPTSLGSIEPAQILSLEVAAQALADAGYSRREFDRSRTSVIFGAEGGTDLSAAYGFRALFETYAGALPEALDEHLPALTEDSFPGLLTNVIAGRIANRLDLGGSNFTVDAACASALAAVDVGCKELVAGTSDMVLCGGADLHNGINDYLLFASVHALSPSGQCRTFDADADGIALGEGVACVVLKRRADAESDGDRIYAVLRGVAGSSDGRSLGLTAPRKEGQRLALQRAYAQAGVSPAEVGLIEAHGTGTVVGDRTELASLTEVFGEAGAEARSCSLGSVKSQIGHTKCAAGVAGLIKAAEAVYRGVRPPTLNIDSPNAYYDGESSPFRFDDVARPWADDVRIAGVSAFGFGGTNFHVVLSRYDGAPTPAHGFDEWPAELFCFRGADQNAARSAIEALERRAEVGENPAYRVSLRDLARAQSEEGSGPVQVAVVADDLDDLRAKLVAARSFRSDPAGIFVRAADGGLDGRVAFLFPGQGSQRPGMLRDLFVAFPRLQRHLRDAGRYSDVMFPPAAHTREHAEAQRAAVTDTRVAQPALGIAGLAMHELLGEVGVRPDLAGGHSYGELVALCVAGAIGESDLGALSKARAEAILAAAGTDPGVMAAVAGPASVVASLLGASEGVVVANDNSPSQSVISGPSDAVETALAVLADAGLTTTRLPVACAFHSPVVAGADCTLADVLAGCEVLAPRYPVWSNATAAPYPDVADGVRATLAKQVVEPVRFTEQIEAMYTAGARTFVEAGPGRVLTQLVDRILGDRPHTAVACDVPGEHGLRRFLLALGELAARGVEVDLEPLFLGRDAVAARASAPARLPGWIVNGHLVRSADGAVVPGGLRPVDAVPPVRLAGSHVGADHDAVVLEYLRSAREMMAAQREVVLRYLGGPIAAHSPVLPIPPAVSASRAPIETTGTDVAAPARGPMTAEDLMAAVLAVVSERTGYPLDMLDPELDLEADLSIDSIKRIEIIGELVDRVGLPGTDEGSIDESVIEELVQLRTLRGIVDWIHALSSIEEAGTGSPPVEVPESPPVEVPESPPVEVPESTRRYVVQAEDVDAATSTAIDVVDREYAVVDDGSGVALHLARLLEERGAIVRLIREDQQPGAVDGLVHLGSLSPGGDLRLSSVFAQLKQALSAGAGELLVATGMGGAFGSGPARPGFEGLPSGAGIFGLVRTIAREFPDRRIRAIDIDLKDDPNRIALGLLAELLADDDLLVVGHTNGTRRRLTVVPAELDDAGATDAPILGSDSVVLLTGGARGITARVAVALARATGCRVELAGRTRLAEASEDAATAGAQDLPSLRKALIAEGLDDPAAIEAACREILASREVRATMALLADVGAQARYHQVDVKDAHALEAVVAEIYERHGRLDGVVHGAGILEDRLVRDKSVESFDRVFATKAESAGTLLGALRPDVGFVVLFGSIVGVFGNRGQVDYAAANDALDTLARARAPRFAGRVVSVDWGPWAGAGMVSAELEREYLRRGIGLIDPDDGVACLLRELEVGVNDVQVVLMRALPAQLHG